MKKVIHANSSQKELEWLYSDKLDFQKKFVMGDKEGHSIMTGDQEYKYKHIST